MLVTSPKTQHYVAEQEHVLLFIIGSSWSLNQMQQLAVILVELNKKQHHQLEVQKEHNYIF